jgi:hypothetical protein
MSTNYLSQDIPPHHSPEHPEVCPKCDLEAFAVLRARVARLEEALGTRSTISTRTTNTSRPIFVRRVALLSRPRSANPAQTIAHYRSPAPRSRRRSAREIRSVGKETA